MQPQEETPVQVEVREAERLPRLSDLALAVPRLTAADPWLVFPFGVTFFFAAADALLLPTSNLVIAPENFGHAARILGVLVLSYFVGRYFVQRFRKYDSARGVFVRRRAEGLAMLSKTGAMFVPFAWFSALYMYLATANTRPLIDRQLAELDAALGFDWIAFLRFVNASPLLADALIFAYGVTGISIAGIFILHSLVVREDRLMEFFALLSLTSLVTGILMYVFPAAGAYAWYKPAAELFSNYPGDAGMWHHAQLVALRSGEPFVFNATHGTGMVTFPSFHTQLGIIITYSVRRMRFVFPAVLLLNATMIVATLPVGGHHLVDLIAGGVIATLAILAVRAYAATSDAGQNSGGAAISAR